MKGENAQISQKTLINAVLTPVKRRDFINLMKGMAKEPYRVFRNRLGGCLLLVVAYAIAGCDKLPGNLFSRGGTDLSSNLVENQESTYQSVVDSSIPTLSRTGGGVVQATLKFKIRTRTAGKKDSDGIMVQGDILEGDMKVGGRQSAAQLVGQKITFRISSLRRQSQWAGVGLGIPVGLELFDLGVPNGKIKAGETWKVETERNLLQMQDSIRITRNFSIRGEESFGGQPCYAVTTIIPASSKKLSSGVSVEVSGKGDAWIAKKDGRILRITESLQGVVRDERQGNLPSPFSQNIEVSEVSVASAVPQSTPAVSAPIAAVKPVAPTPLTNATAVVATPAGLTMPVAAVQVVEPIKSVPVAPQSVTSMESAIPVSIPVPAKAPPASVALVTKVEPAKPVSVPFESIQERITFVSSSTAKKQIWSMGVDGKAKASLTGYLNPNWFQAIDQTGKSMACISKRAEGVNIWLVDLESGNSTPVTNFSETDDIRVGWSDGSSKIVFMKQSKLWAISRDGYNLQSFDIDGSVVSFDATPDTAQVALVVSVLNQKKIQVVDVNSGTVRDLFEGDMPMWAPKGEKLVYRNQETLNVSRADGTGTKVLYKGRILNSPIFWDPTGRKVALTVQEGENALPTVLIIDEASGLITKVTTRGGYAQAFSPSGEQIAYILHGDLWVAKVDGATHIQMTSDGATSGPVRWGKNYVH